MADSMLRICFDVGVGLAVAVLCVLQIRTGTEYLRGGGLLNRAAQPLRFWIVIALEIVVAAYLIGNAL
jgi:hypothetical protein